MGVRQELRDIFGSKYEDAVSRIAGINKFTHPELNKEKVFKIREPMKRGEYSNFVQRVDEMQEVKNPNGTKTYVVIYDGKGKPKEDLPHSLTMLQAAQIEGNILKALNGRDPDDDLNISRGSIWKVKGTRNPLSGPTPTGGEYGEVMFKFTLITLDGKTVGEVLAGTGGEPSKQVNAEEQAKYT